MCRGRSRGGGTLTTPDRRDRHLLDTGGRGVIQNSLYFSIASISDISSYHSLPLSLSPPSLPYLHSLTPSLWSQGCQSVRLPPWKSSSVLVLSCQATRVGVYSGQGRVLHPLWPHPNPCGGRAETPPACQLDHPQLWRKHKQALCVGPAESGGHRAERGKSTTQLSDLQGCDYD